MTLDEAKKLQFGQRIHVSGYTDPRFFVGIGRAGVILTETEGGFQINSWPHNVSTAPDRRLTKHFRCYRSSPDPRIAALERRK